MLAGAVFSMNATEHRCLERYAAGCASEVTAGPDRRVVSCLHDRSPPGFYIKKERPGPRASPAAPCVSLPYPPGKPGKKQETRNKKNGERRRGRPRGFSLFSQGARSAAGGACSGKKQNYLCVLIEAKAPKQVPSGCSLNAFLSHYHYME